MASTHELAAIFDKKLNPTNIWLRSKFCAWLVERCELSYPWSDFDPHFWESANLDSQNGKGLWPYRLQAVQARLRQCYQHYYCSLWSGESGSVGLVWSDRPLVVNNQPSKLAVEADFSVFSPMLTTHYEGCITSIHLPSASHAISIKCRCDVMCFLLIQCGAFTF